MVEDLGRTGFQTCSSPRAARRGKGSSRQQDMAPSPAQLQYLAQAVNPPTCPATLYMRTPQRLPARAQPPNVPFVPATLHPPAAGLRHVPCNRPCYPVPMLLLPLYP